MGGAELHGQVLYEVHAGTFTPEGTWLGAMRQLPYLAETGITGIELMPLADFAGRFGWGYDGVTGSPRHGFMARRMTFAGLSTRRTRSGFP